MNDGKFSDLICNPTRKSNHFLRSKNRHTNRNSFFSSSTKHKRLNGIFNDSVSCNECFWI